MVSKILFKIVEDTPSHSLYRVKEGTVVYLNILVGPPASSLSLPDNSPKEASLCSILLSKNSNSFPELQRLLTIKLISISTLSYIKCL